MSWIDHAVIVVILGSLALVSRHFSRRAGTGTDEFILGGGKMPWWLAGISVIATGINTSTPLSDGRKMRNDGIRGQWFNWQAVISGTLIAVWLARLYRRAKCATPLEFYAVRYGSRPASVARCVDVFAIGGFNAVIWSAVGMLAFKKICLVLFGLPAEVTIAGAAIPTGWLVVIAGVLVGTIYATMAGVYNIVWTDVYEFVLTMGCCYLLFGIVFAQVGWPWGLREKILALPDGGKQMLSLLPEFGPALLVLLFVQPIVSQGQWNPSIQRYLCVKDEREVLRTSLFSQFVSMVVRPWPFLMIGVIGMFLVSDAQLLTQYPAIDSPNGLKVPDFEMVFPALAKQYLPVGVTGLLMAGFIISFMGSLASNVHSNASLLVNDLYRPFIVRDAPAKHYVTAMRVAMVVIPVTAIVASLVFNNILSMIVIALTVNNCSGLVKLLRFIWWRVNGWAELMATIVGLLGTMYFYLPLPPTGKALGRPLVEWIGATFGQTSNDAFYAIPILLLLVLTTATTLITIAVTKPEPMEKLCEFYRRVRPYGWWGPVAKLCPGYQHQDPTGLLWLMTFAFMAYTFGGIFAMIGLLFAIWKLAIVAAVICVGCGILSYRCVEEVSRRTEAEQPVSPPVPL